MKVRARLASLLNQMVGLPGTIDQVIHRIARCQGGKLLCCPSGILMRGIVPKFQPRHNREPIVAPRLRSLQGQGNRNQARDQLPEISLHVEPQRSAQG